MKLKAQKMPNSEAPKDRRFSSDPNASISPLNIVGPEGRPIEYRDGEIRETAASPAYWIDQHFQGKGLGPYTELTDAARAACREIERLRSAMTKALNFVQNDNLPYAAKILDGALNHGE